MANISTITLISSAGQEPTTLKPGQLAINVADSPPTLFVGDAGSAVQVVNSVYYSSSAPVAAKDGSLWYEPTSGNLQVYAGGKFNAVSSGGGGASVVAATAAEVLAGVEAGKYVSPATLRSLAANAPDATPTNDANRLIRLDAQGKIHPGFLSIPGGLNYRGEFDVTSATLPGTPASGDYILNSAAAAGNPDAAWTGMPAAPVQPGSFVMFDGTGWHDVGAALQADSFLPLLGGQMTDTAVIEFDNPGGAVPTTPPVRIDGLDPARSAIDNFTLSGGALAPPTPAAITAVAGAVANDEVDITFAGGPADQAYTVTLTYTSDAGAGQTQTINVQQGDTPDMVANRGVAAITGDIVGSKNGVGVLHIALGTATALTAMAATVA